VLAADQEICGDRGPVRAGREVGDVALIPAGVLALASSSRLKLWTAPSRAMNRFRQTGASPATAVAPGDLLVDPAQRPSGPVGRVRVVDPLLTALLGGARGPESHEHVPVGDLLSRVNPAPLVHRVSDVGDLHAEDERQSLGPRWAPDWPRRPSRRPRRR
jgi:hypothetical protein